LLTGERDRYAITLCSASVVRALTLCMYSY
jgi:hypothetical protein